MSNPNFVSDLVAMAKAFEELPQVQSDLAHAREDISNQAATIQRLELKLIERANEIADLHASLRKMEVERDHAERMFLETDDRLNAFRQLVQKFRAEVETYDAVAQPPKEVPAEPSVSVEGNAITSTQSSGDAGQAPSGGLMSEDHIDGPFPYTKADLGATSASGDTAGDGREPGQSAQGEPSTNTDQSPTASADTTAPTAETSSQPAYDAGVSVSSDPMPATESSSENGSQGSQQGESAVDPTGNTTAQDVSLSNGLNAASIGVNVSDSASVTTTHESVHASGTSDPDVGYHNEPDIRTQGWPLWDAWCDRMNSRYGSGRWPQRPDAPSASRASTY